LGVIRGIVRSQLTEVAHEGLRLVALKFEADLGALTELFELNVARFVFQPFRLFFLEESLDDGERTVLDLL